MVGPGFRRDNDFEDRMALLTKRPMPEADSPSMRRMQREEPMRLKDKVAIITGAGHGMGEAEARLFAQEGAKVMAADILGGEAERVAAEIRKCRRRGRRRQDRRHERAAMESIDREDTADLWPARHP